MERNISIEKLVAIITDGAPPVKGRHSGFIANCKADPDCLGFLDDNVLLHTGNRGLSRGKILQHFLSLLTDVKALME